MPRTTKMRPVQVDKARAPLLIVGGIVFGLLITGGTILWAKSGGGQIDVSATISNSQMAGGDTGVEDNTPGVLNQESKVHTSLPNGGLQAQGGEVASPPPPPEVVPTETASTTATTTEVTTTESTEEGSEGEEASSDTPAQTDTPNPSGE